MHQSGNASPAPRARERPSKPTNDKGHRANGGQCPNARPGKCLPQDHGRIGICMSKIAPLPGSGANKPTLYAIVPRSVLEDRALTDAAVRLYGVLDSRVGKYKDQQIRRDTLAADLGWSVSKVTRSLAELETAGLVAVKRTPRSSRYAVVNPARSRSRESGIARGSRGSAESDSSDVSNLTQQSEWCVNSDPSDVSNLTRLLSITSLSNTSMAGSPAAPERGGGDPSISGDEKTGNDREMAGNGETSQRPEMNDDAAAIKKRTNNYLAAITAKTRIHLDANHLTAAAITTIHRHGLTAEETAGLVAQQLRAARGTIRNPAGFIVKYCLPHIAENRINAEPEETKTPPAWAVVTTADRCDHGEIAGRCALCRQAKQQQPTGKTRKCGHYVTINAEGKCPTCVRLEDEHRERIQDLLGIEPNLCFHGERGPCLKCAQELDAARASIAAAKRERELAEMAAHGIDSASPTSQLDLALARLAGE